MCCIGLVANVVCLLVMSRPRLRKGKGSSVNVILTGMAAVDIVVLICSFSMCGLKGINYAVLVWGWTPKWIGESQLPIQLGTLLSSLLRFSVVVKLIPPDHPLCVPGGYGCPDCLCLPDSGRHHREVHCRLLGPCLVRLSTNPVDPPARLLRSLPFPSSWQ